MVDCKEQRLIRGPAKRVLCNAFKWSNRLAMAFVLLCVLQVSLTSCEVSPTETEKISVDSSSSSNKGPIRRLASLGIDAKVIVVKKADGDNNNGGGGDKNVDIAKRICKNKKVRIGSLDEMLYIVGDVIRRADSLKCDPYRSAIFELDPILKLERNRLCDSNSIDMIKAYHFRFIQPMRRSNRAPTQFEPMPKDLVKEQLHPEPRTHTVEFDQYNQALMAPISVRHFFLKFALQVSLQCKRLLIANLLADTDHVLTEQDREMMQLFDTNSVYGQSLGAAIDELNFDTVLHIPELDGKARGVHGELLKETGEQQQHYQTDASADSALVNVIYSCKNRFKPIYDKLIMPVVRLSKLGYDYQGSQGFTQDEQEFLSGAELKTWLVIVHICEIFKNTHLIKASDSSAESLTPSQQNRKKLSEHFKDMDKDEQAEANAEADAEAELMDDYAPKVIDEAEEERLLANSVVEKFAPIDYELTIRRPIENELLIKSRDELDVELARKHDDDPLGFRGLLRRFHGTLFKMLSKLDLNRFAHFRRHSARYAGFLNLISALSNIASITVTLHGIGLVFG